jgi:putative tryptophan/tyrosine transport system substrate-binding protein
MGPYKTEEIFVKNSFFKISLFIIFVFTVSMLLLQCTDNSKKIVGISKMSSNPAMDAVEQGIQDELRDLKLDVEFDLQNAGGDINTAASIADKFNTEKVKVAVGISTPAAQALVNHIKNIPIVFSAVADPVKAGLVASIDKGSRNVTGVSDMTPVKEQIYLFTQIRKIKKLGLIYSSNEDSSLALADIAKNTCGEMGIEAVEAAVTSSAEVKQAVESIIGRVDGIYISTGSVVLSAISDVADAAMRNKVPVMSADPDSAKKYDILAAWGFDYYKMGRETGKMAAEILSGKKPEIMQTRFMTDASDMDLLLNLDAAKKLGIKFQKDTLDMANRIISNGQMITNERN